MMCQAETASGEPVPAPGKNAVSVRHPMLLLFLMTFVLRLIFALPGLMEKNDELTRFQRPDSPSFLAPAASLAGNGDYRGPDGAVSVHRPPGYPAILAVLSLFGGRRFQCLAMLLIGSLAVLPVYGSCRIFASRASSFFAAFLFALNPTSISSAPLFLSDTLFTLLVAISFYCCTCALKRKDPFLWLGTVFFAAVGALIRPLNLLWILPGVLFPFFFPGMRLWKKFLLVAGSAALFVLILFPWMLRNHSLGTGWRLGSSGSMMLLCNASSVKSALTGVPEETVRAGYEQEIRQEILANPEEYAASDARQRLLEKRMMREILKHPFLYAAMTLRPYVLLPDIPSLLENLGVTVSGRGTLDVLNRKGFAAAVVHYFRGKGFALAATLPLIAASMILYAAALAGVIFSLVRKNWTFCYLFLFYGAYYLILPGLVAMPRYQLPALPVFCFFAALGGDWLSAVFPVFRAKRRKS